MTERDIEMKTLNRSMVIAGVLALSGIVVASLAVAGNIGYHNKRQNLVHATSIDSNGDGQLTRDELLAHSHTRFDRLDANSDGLISPDEYGSRLVNMFERMDTNRNGILEGNELPHRMKTSGHYKGHMKKPSSDS